MLSDITRICRNISLIIHYKLIDVSNIVQAYIQDYYDSWKKSPRYIDNPRYIYQDYDYSTIPSDNFDAVTNFFNTMPKVSHTVKVTNPKTQVESDIKIEGLESFLG